MKTPLTLQINSDAQIERDLLPGVMITPAISPDYWLYRVAVSAKQAVVGFPKFGVVGIGFQHEDDWNTNLPSGCDTAQIYQHIACNRTSAGDNPSPARCKAAIELIKAAVAASLPVS